MAPGHNPKRSKILLMRTHAFLLDSIEHSLLLGCIHPSNQLATYVFISAIATPLGNKETEPEFSTRDTLKPY